MAVKTAGFQVSTLPRAPAVPGNLGAIDVKEIYDGVRRGLATVEAARSAPIGMALADTQAQAVIDQSPLKTRQVLAQTEGLEAQTPLKTAILAAEASPAMLEAKRQALLNRNVKAPTGDVQLATALAGARQRLADDPNDAAAAQLVAALEPIALRKSAVSAADPQGAINAGITKAAIADTTKRDLASTADTTKRELAAADRTSAETRATNTIRSREDVAKLDRESRERVSASQNAVRQAIQSDKTGAQKAKVATAAKARLDALDQRSDTIDRSIEEALPKIGVLTAGFPGNLLSLIPGSDAKDVRRLIDAVRSNIGFEELNSLRAQSPTGGALGQVSDRELLFLQSVLGSLEQDQSPAQLRQNLELIRDRYRELRQERHEAFEKDFGVAATAPTAATRSFANEAELEAAAARGEVRANDQVTVGGVPGRYQP